MKKCLPTLILIPFLLLLSCTNETLNLLASGTWTVTEAYRDGNDVTPSFTSVPHTIRFLTNRTYNTDFPSLGGVEQGNFEISGNTLIITPNSTGIAETWDILRLETDTMEVQFEVPVIGTYRLVLAR